MTALNSDNANGDNKIAEIVLNKYNTVYNSVPTSDAELSNIRMVLMKGLLTTTYKTFLYFSIISRCVVTVDSIHRLYTYLSMLFNAMNRHGPIPRELLLSSIISNPKDMKSFLSDSNIYRGISMYNAICKVYANAIICLCYKHCVTFVIQFGFKANPLNCNV